MSQANPRDEQAIPNSSPEAATIAALEHALTDEAEQYEKLLILALDQGKLMTETDLNALQDSTDRLAQGLAQVETVRAQREQLTHDAMGRSGTRNGRLSTWLASQPDALRQRLTQRVQQVQHAAKKLVLANERNRRLANFCLDLVEEEAAVLRRGLLEDPAGRYDRGAQPAQDGSGRMLEKKA